jgi:hypothetical protein
LRRGEAIFQRSHVALHPYSTQAGRRRPSAPADHRGIQQAGIEYFFTLIIDAIAENLQRKLYA